MPKIAGIQTGTGFGGSKAAPEALQTQQGAATPVSHTAPSLPLATLIGRPVARSADHSKHDGATASRQASEPERRLSARRSASTSDIQALFAAEAKKARRQGFVMPKASARAPALDASVRALLNGALNGATKFTAMDPLRRDHVFKMLEANDLPGLQALAEAGNPLRSMATGLKIGKHLLDRHDAESFPPPLRESLTRLATFYDAHPKLIELGDSRAFSEGNARSPDDVQALRAATNEAGQRLNDVRDALHRLT